MFYIVAACSKLSRGIGYNNKLSWPTCKTDMNYFRQLTVTTKDPSKRNAVIMGRKTFDSLQLPQGLSRRFNVIISRSQSRQQKDEDTCANIFSSLDNALVALKKRNDIETIFVIGGQEIYEQAIKHPECEKIYLNYIKVREAMFDRFFPEVNESIYGKESETILDETVTNVVYQRRKNI